jgi:hypothetical protein
MLLEDLSRDGLLSAVPLFCNVELGLFMVGVGTGIKLSSARDDGASVSVEVGLARLDGSKVVERNDGAYVGAEVGGAVAVTVVGAAVDGMALKERLLNSEGEVVGELVEVENDVALGTVGAAVASLVG